MIEACTLRDSWGDKIFGPVVATARPELGSPPEIGRPTVTIHTSTPGCSNGPEVAAGERMWLIRTQAIENQRDAAVPVGPIVPSVTKTGSWSRNTRVKVAINTGSPRAGPEPWMIDVGHALALFADRQGVTVRILAPEGSRTAGADGPLLAGLVFDAQVNLQILEIGCCRQNLWAPLTQSFELPGAVPAGSPAFAMRIPFGARRLHMFHGASGNYPPTTRWFIGDPLLLPAVALDIGIVAWAVAGQRRVDRGVPVPNASHLVFNGGAAGRTVTLLWEIWA